MKSLVTLVFGIALAPFAAAQLCFGPDNLNNGPCCQPIQANLPQFQPASLPGCTICWTNCSPSGQNNVKISVGVPIPFNCGQYQAPISVADGTTGLPILGGMLQLDYTRTWSEATPTGPIQVWRFVAKVDLSPSTAAGTPNPCMVPPQLFPTGPYQTAFYYGYMDYSVPCGAIAQQQSLVLFHGADHFQHKPGLSSRPQITAAGFHPNRSYAIVAPHTAAQPFMPMNLPAPGGPLVNEAMRNTQNPFAPGLCTVEDRISLGNLIPVGQGCFAPFAVAPPQYTIRVFNGQGSCPNTAGLVASFSAQNIAFPTLPWVFLVTTSLGTWTNPTVWPGNEAVWVDEGLFRTRDVCNGVDAYEVYYGASTQMGFPVTSAPGVTPNYSFIDIADNYSTPVTGPNLLPILGHVMKTEHLIYANTP